MVGRQDRGGAVDDMTVWRDRGTYQVIARRTNKSEVIDALKAAMPGATMSYTEMTQLAYAAVEMWDMAIPKHWHHPSGFGTLGYATPAAIGGAIARPNKPTMAMIGDYGFHYTMAELGVAVEFGLSIPIILWDNAKLGEIDDSMIAAQIAPRAVLAHNPDFCKLAQACGARSSAPENLNDLKKAVRSAFNADGPTLIHISTKILT